MLLMASGRSSEAAGAPYSANPVHFDGVNDYLQISGAFSTIADGTIILLSGWIRDIKGTDQRRIFTLNVTSADRLAIWIGTSDTMELIGCNASGSVVLRATGPVISNTNWHHYLISLNLSNAAQRAWYHDGVASSPSWTTYSTSNTLDLNGATNTYVGRTGSGNLWQGDMADLYFATPSVWFDPASGSNLTKFITNGLPANPSGWPTDGPHMGLTGATATWQDNTLGDNFTEVGALTDGTGPVQL